MSNQSSVDFETFEIGGGIGDIGGDEIDLASLNITDTLIGQTASELTAALGEPSINEYENYHMGDGGISDIELTSFDSALINDAGVRPYTADEASAMDEASELAELMGKKLETPKAKKEKAAPAKKEAAPVAASAAKPEAKKEPAKKDDFAATLAGLVYLSRADEETKDLVDDETAPWHDADIFNKDTGALIEDTSDDDVEFDDADFEMELGEYIHLQNDVASGLISISA